MPVDPVAASDRHLRLDLPAVARRRSIRRSCRSGASWRTSPSGSNSVEVNGTFYGLQRPASVRGAGSTRRRTDFVFAVKGGRFITHLKKLADVGHPLANFLASGVLALGTEARARCCGSCRPPWASTPSGWPTSSPSCRGPPAQAADLAARHDHRITADRELVTTAHPDHPLRHALEVRHDSFRTPALVDLLREHDIALVWADNPGTLADAGRDHHRLPLRPAARRHRAVRQRLHRRGARPRGRRGSAAGLDAGQDVYVYCDNDAKVRAPYDAMGLLDRLGLAKPAARDSAVAGETKRVPRAPERAHLPLLSSDPGGVG